MAVDPDTQSLLKKQEHYLLEKYRRNLQLLAGGIAHEFNNLLVGAMGYAQLSLDEPDDRKLSEMAAKTCIRMGRRGADIVRRLHHFAAEDMPAWETADLAGVVRDLVEVWRPRAEEHGISIETQLDATPPVRLDPQLLGMALLDIFANAEVAAMRGEAPGLVRITVRTEDGDAVARIEDNGPGMTAEELEVACEPFYTTRGAFAYGDDPDARGLGLSSARGILERLGGTLDLSSTPGEGAEIRIALPLRDMKRGHRGRVLVVDDEPAIRRIFAGFLKRQGYDAVTAEDGKAGLAAATEGEFDLILLDQMMPHVSGIQMLEVLDGMRETRSVPPVVMITAAYSPDLARKALELGASACVSKPVNRERVLYLAAAFTGGDTFGHTQSNPVREMASGFSERILVVDASALTRDLLGLLLRRAGYRVRLADTSDEGVRVTEEEYFDLILVDMLDSSPSARQMIRAMRLNNPYTPILVTSPRLSRQSLRDAFHAGATQALRKPIDVQAILGELRRVLDVFGGSSRPTKAI